MGRMFDVLRQAEPKRTVGEVTAVPVPAEDDFVSDAANEEVPFIEVGPARSLEASAAVLAVPTPRLRIAPCIEGRRDGETERQRDRETEREPIPLSLPPSVPPSLRPSISEFGVSLCALPGRQPEQRFASDLVAFHQPDHPSAVEYREVAAALMKAEAAGTSRVWLCLGVAAGAGTTSVVLNLAMCLAATPGLRVVVVDANLSRPAIAERLGLRGRPGLAEVLDGRESLDQAIQQTGVDRLTALTAGQFDRDRTPPRIEEACRPVLRLLRDRCDVVLIDGGLDADELGRACDAVYLVVPQVRADEPATAERSWGLLRKGALLRGCIVTGHR